MSVYVMFKITDHMWEQLKNINVVHKASHLRRSIEPYGACAQV